MSELRSKCHGAKVKLKANSKYRGFRWAAYCSKCGEPCYVVKVEKNKEKKNEF